MSIRLLVIPQREKWRNHARALLGETAEEVAIDVRSFGRHAHWSNSISGLGNAEVCRCHAFSDFCMAVAHCERRTGEFMMPCDMWSLREQWY